MTSVRKETIETILRALTDEIRHIVLNYDHDVLTLEDYHRLSDVTGKLFYFQTYLSSESGDRFFDTETCTWKPISEKENDIVPDTHTPQT